MTNPSTSAAAGKKLAWREPKWSWQPRFDEEIRSSKVLTRKFWTHTIGISVVVIAPVIVLMTKGQPGIQIPWPQLLGGLAMMPAFLLLHVFLMRFIPSRISVSPRMIIIAHGQSTRRIRMDRLIEARLRTDDQDRVWLGLLYGKAGDESSIWIGVAEKIDLEELSGILGEKLLSGECGESGFATVRELSR